MRKNSYKLVLIASIFLNVLLVILSYNNHLNKQRDYAFGDPSAYRTFIHGLTYFSESIGTLKAENSKSENTNILINAKERLNLAMNSYIKFENSMASTNLESSILDDKVAMVNDSMFKVLSSYVRGEYDLQQINQFKKQVDELLNNLPKSYDTKMKEDFIKTINNLSY